MIKITRAEADELRVRAPAAHIAITNRQSSHKSYSIEESYEVKRLLPEIRSRGVVWNSAAEGTGKAKKKRRRRNRHRNNGSRPHEG